MLAWALSLTALPIFSPPPHVCATDRSVSSVCLCAVAGIQQRMQKKDEKLEKLKACLDVFETVEEIRAECNWDEMMT